MKKCVLVSHALIASVQISLKTFFRMSEKSQLSQVVIRDQNMFATHSLVKKLVKHALETDPRGPPYTIKSIKKIIIHDLICWNLKRQTG